MRAEFWAVLTAFCWGFGSLLEKRGVKIGHLTPVMGSAIRTAFSLGLLMLLSIPFLGQLKTAGTKSILLIAVGGGVLAGGMGLVCLYTGLKHGNLSTVMTISFCLAPIFGAVLGYFVLRENLSLPQLVGIFLCLIGAAITMYFKAP